MSIEKFESYGSQEGRTFVSRAVKRKVEAGAGESCAAGDGYITFSQKRKPEIIIANVYDDDGVWQRTEWYHPECYEQSGEPHGSPFTKSPLLTREQREDISAV